MKRSVTSYAAAFCDVIKVAKTAAQEDRIVKELIAQIRIGGDWSRRGMIVAACEQAYYTQAGTPAVTVESARPLTKDQKKKVEDIVRKHIQNATILEKSNPSLVAGVRIRLGDMQFDASLQRTLREITTRS